MKMIPLDLKTTALVLVDLQNDFFHDDGAASRSELTLENSRSFIETVMNLCDFAKSQEMLTIGLSTTLITDTNNDAIIPTFIDNIGLKVFRGDFQVTNWGHRLIEEITPVEYQINKIAPSGFFKTELDIILQSKGVKTVILAGLNSTSSLVSTAYDALNHGLNTILIEDAITDFNEKSNQELLSCMSSIFSVEKLADFKTSVNQVTTL